MLRSLSRSLVPMVGAVVLGCGSPTTDVLGVQESTEESALFHAGRTWVVDDDQRPCRHADFTSLSAAVAAASNGDTIRVCAGEYGEDVRVDKTLRLMGTVHGRAAWHREVPLSRESVLTGTVTLAANNVVLRGFVLRKEPPPPDPENGSTVGEALVTEAGFSGYQILNNVVLDSRVQMRSSGGEQTVVYRNLFESQSEPETSCEVQTVVPKLRVQNNLFRQCRLLATSFTGFTPHDIQIKRNSFLGFFANLAVLVSADILVEDNYLREADLIVSGAQNAAVLDNRLEDGFGGLTVSGENLRVEDNQLINAEGLEVGLAGGDNLVQGNVVRDCFGDGISLSGQSGGTVQGNVVSGCEGSGLVVRGSRMAILGNEVEDNSGRGIRVFATVFQQATANAIVDNTVTDNGEEGIRMEALAVNNLLRDNDARGNGDVDCFDGSTGSGTAGTGNLWRRNRGLESDPNGLCFPRVEEPECVPPPADLISWWPGNGNAQDVAGANDGTRMGNVTFADGVVGQAFRIDNQPPADSNITIGNPANLQLQDLTLDAWVQGSPTSVVGYSAGTGGYQLGVNEGRLFLSKSGVSNVNSGNELVITDNNWHHVAVTRSGSTVVFYLDGVPSKPLNYSVTFEFTNVTFVLGSGSYNGRLDEVEVFGRALQPMEILDIFHAGTAGKCLP